MSTATDLIDASNKLIADRVNWDAAWETIARLVMPVLDKPFNKGSETGTTALEGWAAQPASTRGLAQRYDITAMTGLDRLSNGVISLVTPDNEKWQSLGGADELGGVAEASDVETRWLERQRDYLFNVRYNPLSGWVEANQSAVRSMCAFGTGLYLIEEAWGARGQSDRAIPWRCHTLPLSENYITCDAQGVVDQDYRRFRLTARQAAQRFGTGLSGKTLDLANDPVKREQPVEFLHYIGYRAERGLPGDAMADAPVVSWYLEVNEKHWVRRSGFSAWPVIAYHWNKPPNSAYGESPVMLVLAEILGANILAKNGLLSAQQLTRPPIGTSDDARMARPNLNPSAINYNAIDAAGRLKIQPIITAQNPAFVQEIKAASQQQIKDGLYTNLWQILLNNPDMTATEALIRSNEKGELLGPIGTRMQMGLSMLTDAELTILKGKGAWDQGGILEAPEAILGRDLRPVFNSPLNRMRRSSEVIAIRQTIEMAGILANAGKTDVLDRLDEDAILDIQQDVSGAPRKMFRSDDDVEAIRAARAQQQQAMAAMQAAQAAGEAGQKALPAIDMAQKMARGQPLSPA